SSALFVTCFFRLLDFFLLFSLFFFLMLRLPLRSTLFPYTTLFRSIRLFLLVLILLLMPTLNFLPVWFALSLLRFRLRLKANQTRSEERFSRNAETDLVCRLLLEKKKKQNIKEYKQTTNKI